MLKKHNLMERKRVMLIQKTFFFVRHGVTDWNLQGRIMGHQDIRLIELLYIY